jgi:hypothetical protein
MIFLLTCEMRVIEVPKHVMHLNFIFGDLHFMAESSQFDAGVKLSLISVRLYKVFKTFPF